MLKLRLTILIAKISVYINFLYLPLEYDEFFLSYLSNQELKNNKNNIYTIIELKKTRVQLNGYNLKSKMTKLNFLR